MAVHVLTDIDSIGTHYKSPNFRYKKYQHICQFFTPLNPVDARDYIVHYSEEWFLAYKPSIEQLIF